MASYDDDEVDDGHDGDEVDEDDDDYNFVLRG